jgi:hypothetical protein
MIRGGRLLRYRTCPTLLYLPGRRHPLTPAMQQVKNGMELKEFTLSLFKEEEELIL